MSIGVVWNRGARRAHHLAMHKLLPGAEIAEPRSPDDGVTMARELADRHDTVVAVGGDGTVNAVVNGISGTGVALGILPFGTGNVLAAAVDLPKNDAKLAARICSEDVESWVDVGVCGEREFVASIGFGYDAMVCALCDRWKWALGKGAFAAAALALQFRERPWRAVIKADGQQVFEGEIVLAAAINSPRYGGFLLASRDTSAWDGLLDLAVVLPGRWPRCGIFLPMLLGTFRTGDSIGRVRVFRAKEFEFDIEPSPPCQIDGEEWQTAHRIVSVKSRTLRMKTPRVFSRANEV